MRSGPRQTHSMPQVLQRGVAAIEFSFVFMVLFVVLYGIATFGAVFYTQQMLTRAAEDGARAISMFQSPTQAQIQALVRDSLGSPLKDMADLQVTAPVDTDPIVVTVTYPYRDNALLPPLPFTGAWMPGVLRGRAAAARPVS